MLSTQHDLETHESNNASRDPARQLPEAQATALPFYVGLALIVVAVAYCLLDGKATLSWLCMLVTGLSTSVGVGLICAAVARLHLAQGRVYAHVTHLHFDLLDVEHKLFLSHARSIDLETQLLLQGCVAIRNSEEIAFLQLAAERWRAHRAAIRMLARGSTALAVLLTSAVRTVARHPKSVVAKSRLRDGLAVTQLCIATVDELVGGDAGGADILLQDFAWQLADRCDRSDLSPDVWELARGLLSQAREFHAATLQGDEWTLVDRWLEDPQHLARASKPCAGGDRRQSHVEPDF